MDSKLNQQTQAWYARYYSQLGKHRNDVLNNPEVAFQLFANDAALLKALRKIHAQPETSTILDVGCGSGAGLLNFVRFGFNPGNLHGIDLQSDRIAEARHRIPNCSIIEGDATKMTYATNTFDVVYESTMFVQLTDETLAGNIARDMLRVCKSNGHIILSDWRYSKPFNKNYLGLTNGRLARLFNVGVNCELIASYNASLLPPIGRRLSKYASPLYFPFKWLFPFLCGHVVRVLRKV